MAMTASRPIMQDERKAETLLTRAKMLCMMEEVTRGHRVSSEERVKAGAGR